MLSLPLIHNPRRRSCATRPGNNMQSVIRNLHVLSNDLLGDIPVSSTNNVELLANHLHIRTRHLSCLSTFRSKELPVYFPPVLQGFITLSLESGKLWCHFLKRHDLHVPGLDNAGRLSASQRHDTQPSNRWQWLHLMFVHPQQRSRPPFYSSQNKLREFIRDRFRVREMQHFVKPL